MGEHDEPTLIACNECGREFPVERIARPWDCVCAECDEIDEAFEEYLDIETPLTLVRVHQMRAAGYPWCAGLWITISGCKGQRIAVSQKHVMWLAGSTAVHPHDWPSRPKWTSNLLGPYMSYDDRIARA